MQLIYGWKTDRRIPRYNFPNNFLLSATLKHFSNTIESLKLIDEIIAPHTQSEHTKLQLQIDHPALLIIDMFSGQMTPAVLQTLQENYIFSTCSTKYDKFVSTTRFKQSMVLLRLSWKDVLLSQEIWKELESGQELNDIDTKLTLTILKPLHASWLADLYD